MPKKTTGYITQISGKPGSGQSKTVFRSGAVSTSLQCAQFFMKMQDDGQTIDDARAYARMGPMLAPNIDWAEINRVLETFK